jgi:hypothetical protein
VRHCIHNRTNRYARENPCKENDPLAARKWPCNSSMLWVDWLCVHTGRATPSLQLTAGRQLDASAKIGRCAAGEG